MYYGNAYSPYNRNNEQYISRNSYYEPQQQTLLQNQPVPQYKLKKYGQFYDFDQQQKQYGLRGQNEHVQFRNQEQRDQFVQESQQNLYHYVPEIGEKIDNISHRYINHKSQERFMPQVPKREVYYQPRVEYVPVQRTELIRDVQKDSPWDQDCLEYGNRHYKNGTDYIYSGQMSRYWGPSRYK